MQGIDLALLGIRRNGYPEKRADSRLVQFGQGVGQVGGTGDGVNLREVGLDRLQARGGDRRRVQGGAVKVRHQLLGGTRFMRVRRRIGQDAFQGVLVGLIELVESAPAGFVGRHRVVFLPVPKRVVRKIGPGINRRIHVGHAETQGDGRGGLLGGEGRREQDGQPAEGEHEG